jgi:MoaA/NifB/PqqE/SkfB family radical SAM enzyme
MANIVMFSPCNQRCLHCANPLLVGKEIIESHKEDILSQIKDVAGRVSVCFTGGGEPTMLEYLPELISYAKGLGMRQVGIETNGVKLGDAEYTRLLKDSGLDYCKFSLHSHIEAVSDRITRQPGSFGATLNGIENARKEGIAITSVLHTLSSLNISGFPDFARFMHRCCIESMVVSFIRPLEGDKISEGITPKISEALPMLHEGLRFCKENNMVVGIDPALGVPPCCLTGFMEYCVELRIFREEGTEAHRIKSYAYERTKPESCSGCRHSSCCSGIQKSYVRLYGSSEFIPVKYLST